MVGTSKCSYPSRHKYDTCIHALIYSGQVRQLFSYLVVAMNTVRGAFKKFPDVEKVQVKYVHFKYKINNVSKIPTFGEFCLYNLKNLSRIEC